MYEFSDAGAHAEKKKHRNHRILNQNTECYLCARCSLVNAAGSSDEAQIYAPLKIVLKMDEFENQEEAFEDDFYDEDANNEPFFCGLLKTQLEIAKENAKEREEKLLKKSEEEQKRQEQASESKRYFTRPRPKKVVQSSDDEDNFDDGPVDYSSDEDRRAPSREKERKCLLCSVSNADKPKLRYSLLKGKCRYLRCRICFAYILQSGPCP